jgi:hypothetical protein
VYIFSRSPANFHDRARRIRRVLRQQKKFDITLERTAPLAQGSHFLFRQRL